MLTISRGSSAEYYLGQVAAGRESYYTGAVTEGEPPGRWYGAGAEHLGLRGEVDEVACFPRQSRPRCRPVAGVARHVA